MQPDKIQERALKTWYPPSHLLHHSPLPAVMGIAGEAGEIADQLKKHLYKEGYNVTREGFIDELGDLLYYVAIRAYQIGITLDELSQKNREKLQDGKHGWDEVYNS